MYLKYRLKPIYVIDCDCDNIVSFSQISISNAHTVVKICKKTLPECAISMSYLLVINMLSVRFSRNAALNLKCSSNFVLQLGEILSKAGITKAGTKAELQVRVFHAVRLGIE